MSYNRKIFYISYYEDEEKKGNAGYVKVLENRGLMEAEARLTGVPSAFAGERELVIRNGQETIGKEKICLTKGGGMGKYRFMMNGDLSKLSFRVELAAGYALDSGEVRCEAAPQPVVEEKAAVVETVISAMQGIPAELSAEEDKEVVKEVKVVEKPTVKDKVEKRKWAQIYKTYPHIKPFKDFREYVKLDLKDMVLLSEKKYSLVENSFLLHGYYNYNHLILWKKEKAPVKYYIGVPGNFYEKEKQVALLYGFESFEGEVEPAKEGDFGYYMTEVSI